MQKQNEIKKDQKKVQEPRLNVDAWTREIRRVRTIIVDGKEAILLS